MINSDLKTQIFQEVFPALFSKTEGAAESIEPIVPSMEKYRDFIGRLQKLKKISADMVSQKETLQIDIDDIEKHRIEHLSDEAMEENPEAGKEAAKLLSKSQAEQQKLADIEAVHKNILAKIQAIKEQADEISRACKYELGKYLESRLNALARHYHQLAPEICETLIQIQAVQDLMIQLHAGNSNGFDGNFLMPTIEQGNGNTLEPVLRGDSRQYTTMASDRKEELLTELRALGYPTRY